MELLQKICSFLAWILGVYSTVILIRIIVSWILLFARRSSWRNGNAFNPENPDSPGILISLDSILGKICDPYLNAFSGAASLKRSNIDLTPLLALVILNFVRSVLGMFATVGRITLWTVLAIFVNGIWYSFFTFILVALIILLIIRLVLGYGNNPGANNWINTIDPILDRPVSRVYKLFFKGKQTDDQKVVIASIIFYVILLIGLKWAVNLLINFLLSL